MAKKNEVVPYQLIEDIRYDIEVLKKKLSEPDDKINNLVLEMDAFKQSIHELNDIFRAALRETKDEDILKNQMAALLKQNETIASGIIALADKMENSHPVAAPASMPPPMQAPAMPRSAPAPDPMPPPPLPGKRNALSSIFG